MNGSFARRIGAINMQFCNLFSRPSSMKIFFAFDSAPQTSKSIIFLPFSWRNPQVLLFHLGLTCWAATPIDGHSMVNFHLFKKLLSKFLQAFISDNSLLPCRDFFYLSLKSLGKNVQTDFLLSQDKNFTCYEPFSTWGKHHSTKQFSLLESFNREVS